MVLVLFSKVLSYFSFDTSYLHIEGVKIEGDAVHDVNSVYAQYLDFLTLCCLQFILDPKHDVMGSALRVPLSRTMSVGSSISIEIAYSTTANGTALQFLEKE